MVRLFRRGKRKKGISAREMAACSVNSAMADCRNRVRAIRDRNPPRTVEEIDDPDRATSAFVKNPLKGEKTVGRDAYEFCRAWNVNCRPVARATSSLAFHVPCLRFLLRPSVSGEFFFFFSSFVFLQLAAVRMRETRCGCWDSGLQRVHHDCYLYCVYDIALDFCFFRGNVVSTEWRSLQRGDS